MSCSGGIKIFFELKEKKKKHKNNAEKSERCICLKLVKQYEKPALLDTTCGM